VKKAVGGSSSSSSSSTTVRRGFAFSMNKPRVPAYTLVPSSQRTSLWGAWLQKINSGLKSVELKGILKQVWCNDKGWTIVIQLPIESLQETLQCELEMLKEYPEFMTFVPWGEVYGDEDQLVLKVKNNQATDVIKAVFFEAIKCGDEWVLGAEVKMHVDVTTFCNFPEAGQIGVSIKMVTPVKVVKSELSMDLFGDDFVL
jgi:hypothetical protein